MCDVVSVLYYKYFPHGVDIYFDNVGGEMGKVAVANMKVFGRVAVCGVMSKYDDVGKKTSANMLDIVFKRDGEGKGNVNRKFTLM